MFEGSVAVAVEGPWSCLKRRDGLSVSPRPIEASTTTPAVLQIFFGVDSIPRIGGGVSQSLAGPPPPELYNHRDGLPTSSALPFPSERTILHGVDMKTFPSSLTSFGQWCFPSHNRYR